MENKEEKPVQTNEAFEAYKKAVSELENVPFKDFYKNNPKEMEYLFDKIDIKDLKKFATSVFSLTDIWECLYIASFKKNYNITTEDFKEMVLKGREENIDEFYILKKHSIGFIEVYSQNNKPSCGNRKKFPLYTSFIRTKNMELNKVLTYAFGNADARENFKADERYNFSPIEAMFIFFIFDDKYMDNIKRIKSGKVYFVKRRFMEGLHRYAVAIGEKRNVSHEGTEVSLNEIYGERIKKRRPGLTAIYRMMTEIFDEYNKGESADLEMVIETSKKCKKKLKKFIKRVKKLKKNTTNISN